MQFILNQKHVSTSLPAGTTVLDFVRYHQRLTGTKIGCREGDCGACIVLVGEVINSELVYRTATSCLMAIGNAVNKHIVTVEGLNMDELNPIQQAISDEGATQCGFCTPGFVVSLAGYCLSKNEPSQAGAIAAIDGNICRCTGYRSIEKAAEKVNRLLDERRGGQPLLFATITKILPGYFNHIKDRLTQLQTITNGISPVENFPKIMLSGGTDLYVQKHEEMVHASLNFITNEQALKTILVENNRFVIGGAATITDLLEAGCFREMIPNFATHIRLVSSTPIRNMATIAGNFVNASPIGDLTIFFLALDAQLVLKSGNKTREVSLRKFYKGYKVLDKKQDEFIEKIWFALPGKNHFFNFEKVSKRTHLDIASVNTAISIYMDGDAISSASLSAGGVAPVPFFLQKTSAFLTGKIPDEQLLEEAVFIAQGEVSPIGDVRGSAAYKLLLLGQLIKAHFITLFPALRVDKLLHV